MRALIVMVLLLSTSWGVSSEVVPARSVLYEVARMENGRPAVIANGELLLQVGRTVEAREGITNDPAVGEAGVESLSITAQSAGDGPGQIWLASQVTIVKNRGTRRVTDAETSGAIVGRDIVRVRFDARNRTVLGDPSPIEIVHEENGDSYRLTLMFLN